MIMHTWINKVAILLTVIAIALGVLSVLQVFEFIAGKEYPPREGFGGALPKASGHAFGGPVKLEDFNVAAWPEMFCGKPPVKRVKGGPVITKPAEGPKATFVLKGTMIHSDPSLSSAFIEIKGTLGQKAYFPGDLVGEARLLKIERDFVEIEFHENIVRIDVSEEVVALSKPEGESPDLTPKWLDRLSPDYKEIWRNIDEAKRRELLNLPPKKRRKRIWKIFEKKVQEKRERERIKRERKWRERMKRMEEERERRKRERIERERRLREERERDNE